MGALTYTTFALLAAFGVADAGAHFTKYRYGETFSAFVWWTEKRLPFMRVVWGGAVLVLFTHLVFHLP